jgi:hypothetical protein
MNAKTIAKIVNGNRICLLFTAPRTKSPTVSKTNTEITIKRITGGMKRISLLMICIYYTTTA